MEALIITISHRKAANEDGKYVSPQELFKQELSIQWLDQNNPKIIRKIIAVCNNLTYTEKANNVSK